MAAGVWSSTVATCQSSSSLRPRTSPSVQPPTLRPSTRWQRKTASRVIFQRRSMEQSKAPRSADMALGLVYVIVALVIGWLIGRRSRRRPVAAGGIGSTLIVAYALWAFFGPCEGDDC